MLKSEASHPNPLRLAAYRLRKSAVARCSSLTCSLPPPLTVHHVVALSFLFLIIISWITLNETYAIKLIFEQECLDTTTADYLSASSSNLKARDDSVPSTTSRSWAECTSAAIERIRLSTLGESDASRLNLDVPRSQGGSCRHTLRLGHSSIFGERDGGWNVCGDDFTRTKRLERKTRRQRCIIYSFGINDDPSFDHDVVTRWPECEVFAFDPSIGRRTGDTFLGDGIHFYNIGLGGYNTGESNTRTDERGWQIMTLGSIMDMLGHDRVDVVKMDIEGSEWDTWREWRNNAGDGGNVFVVERIGQLLAEIHFSINTTVHREQVEQLDWFRREVGWIPFTRSQNFRWSRVVSIDVSGIGLDGDIVRSTRCIEVGWRRIQQ